MAKVVLAVGDDISTDVIYPGRFMATVLPAETPQFAFADNTGFNAKLKSKQIAGGSIIVAGRNFGCGSSREQAVSTLKGHDLVIVAKSFARIFLQNSVNLGLQLVEAPEIEASENDELDIDADIVENKTTGKRFNIIAFPKTRQEIIASGGLIPHTRKLIMERRRGVSQRKNA